MHISAFFWACPVHAAASVFSPSRIFRHPPAATVARKGHRVLVVLAPPEHHLQSERATHRRLKIPPKKSPPDSGKEGIGIIEAQLQDQTSVEYSNFTNFTESPRINPVSSPKSADWVELQCMRRCWLRIAMPVNPGHRSGKAGKSGLARDSPTRPFTPDQSHELLFQPEPRGSARTKVTADPSTADWLT